MKTTTDILKSLGLLKSPKNNKIASNYLNLLKLILELKNDIKNVEVLEFNEILPNYRQISEELYKSFDVEFLRTIKITTSFGIYEICAPINTGFYSYLCVVLNIQSDYKKEEENYEIENTIYIDNNIINSITKAVKFSDQKSLNELSKNVYFEFKGGFVNVLATDTQTFYKSQKFDFICENNFNNIILSVPLYDIDIFKSSKNEFLKIDILPDNYILVNGLKIELSNINTKQFENLNFEVNEVMEFKKIEFQKNIKSLKPFLDYRNSVKLHLNGSIDMQPITLSENKTSLKMDYEYKNFCDTDYIFNYKNIDNILTMFKTKTILLSPKNFANKDIALITDNVDSVLLISQSHIK